VNEVNPHTVFHVIHAVVLLVFNKRLQNWAGYSL